MLRATVVSDQISSDLNTALELLLEHNCHEFELRELGLDSALVADPRWLDAAEKAVRVRRFRVTQIATDFFAKPLSEGGAPTDERRVRLFELAKRLSCPRVSIFGGAAADLVAETEADDGLPLPNEDALEALSQFCEAAETVKLEVVLRTRQGTCASTAEETVALIKELEQPNLGLDWDVAECFAAGDGSGLDEIEIVLPVLKTVHVRDAVRRGMSADWAKPVGKGVIPWEDIVERLQAEKFKGPLIADPCVLPKLKESRLALAALLRWIEAARFRKRDDEQQPFRERR